MKKRVRFKLCPPLLETAVVDSKGLVHMGEPC